jgi:hypothetical protein
MTIIERLSNTEGKYNKIEEIKAEIRMVVAQIDKLYWTMEYLDDVDDEFLNRIAAKELYYVQLKSILDIHQR